MMVPVHVAQEYALQVAQYGPYAGRMFGIVTEGPRKLAPGTLAAVKQNAAMARNLDQGPRN